MLSLHSPTHPPGFAPERNTSADLLYSFTDSSADMQLFWEAFPAGEPLQKAASTVVTCMVVLLCAFTCSSSGRRSPRVSFSNNLHFSRHGAECMTLLMCIDMQLSREALPAGEPVLMKSGD